MNARPKVGAIVPFSKAEFERRIERAREAMEADELDALFLTNEANFKYFSGFMTQVAWVSPTRPWYFILPREGQPIVIINEGGRDCFENSGWIADIRTWISPRPEDEGVSQVVEALSNMPRKFGRIGAELGPESRMAIPIGDFLRIRDELLSLDFVDGSDATRRLRLVKSEAEIDRIRHICQITSDAFDVLPNFAEAGDTDRDIYCKLQSEIMLRGAERIVYMSCVAQNDGYRNIMGMPTGKVLEKGDVLTIDTGCIYGDYFCDFNRNFCWGAPSDEVVQAYDVLYRATEAGLSAARPGNTAEDVWRAEANVIAEAGTSESTIGRLGHGLGVVLTEWPSLKEGDKTELVENMVITIEPSVNFGEDRMMATEEDVVIRRNSCEILTRRAPPEIPAVRC